jgi:hypothetical protein
MNTATGGTAAGLPQLLMANLRTTYNLHWFLPLGISIGYQLRTAVVHYGPLFHFATVFRQTPTLLASFTDIRDEHDLPMSIKALKKVLKHNYGKISSRINSKQE